MAHQLQRQGAVRARVIDNTSLFRDIFDLAQGAPRGLFELRPRPLLSVLVGDRVSSLVDVRVWLVLKLVQ